MYLSVQIILKNVYFIINAYKKLLERNLQLSEWKELHEFAVWYGLKFETKLTLLTDETMHYYTKT